MNGNGVCIDSALRDFGLSDVEALIYRTGLEVGARPASTIAEKAGLKRSQTYNILSTLSKIGLVQESEKNSVRHFSFSPPDHLLTILESRQLELLHKREKIQEVLPYLKQLGERSPSKPKIRFYRGMDGIKEVFEDMLREPGIEILGILDPRHSSTVSDMATELWIKRWIEKREANNTRWRGFAVDCEICRKVYAERPSKLRKTKFVTGIDFLADIQIYCDKVAVTSGHTEKIGLIIESKAIADTLRQLMELGWKIVRSEVFEG